MYYSGLLPNGQILILLMYILEMFEDQQCTSNGPTYDHSVRRINPRLQYSLLPAPALDKSYHINGTRHDRFAGENLFPRR